MATPRKKRATDKHNTECDDRTTQPMEEDSEHFNAELQVDFEARSAEDVDFDGIYKLLQQVYLKANINLSEMTEAIIQQNNIGSVFKQIADEDEDVDEETSSDGSVDQTVFSINTVIFPSKKEIGCFQQLKFFLTTRCKDCDDVDQQLFINTLQETKLIGILVNERFINIPPQIALPSFESLWKEVENAKSKDGCYDITYLLMICKTYKTLDPKCESSHKNGSFNVEFVNPEEEFFFEERTIGFHYSVKHERDSIVGGSWSGDEVEMEPMRTVILIRYSQLPKVMARMTNALSNLV